MKKLIFIFIYIVYPVLLYPQSPYRILQADTTINVGTSIVLAIDSTKLYSNFMFSARNPQTGLWTIWRKSLTSHKYVPVFKDNYNRTHVKVSPDKKEMVYVKYKTPKPGAMHSSTLDSAWVCRGSANGENEVLLFVVPQFNKNAIYDLDWSADQRKILFASGNDAYPNLTRDGDIFEYDITTGAIVNKTNNWELWSKFCRYGTDSNQFAFTHYSNFWYANPADIFIYYPNSSSRQITNSTFHEGNFQFCTITHFEKGKMIYRRGLFPDNQLFEKNDTGEHLLLNIPGYGGIQLADQVYAATDMYNNIYIFNEKRTIGVLRISGIDNFRCDEAYNFSSGPIADLNWLGKQNAKITWSTGESGISINAMPEKNIVYKCKVILNDVEYTDSVTIKVTGSKPVIIPKCMALTTSRGIAHQWFLDGVAIAGATDSSFTPQTPGRYAVTITDIKGKVSTSAEITITTSDADSVNKINENVKIIPDPSSSLVHIVAPFPVNLAIINENGKMVTQKNNVTEVDMNELPDGMYSIMIYNDNCLKLKSRRIKKEK